MLDNSPCIDAQERLKHLRYIEILAEESHRPLDEVASLYEETLLQLVRQAAIHDYLAIFTSKRVRLLIGRHANGERPN